MLEQQENTKAYSIWGVKHPSKIVESGIATIDVCPRWEYIKEGSSNKKCLVNIDKKVYSQIELRDNSGITIAKIVVEPTFISRKQERNDK